MATVIRPGTDPADDRGAEEAPVALAAPPFVIVACAWKARVFTGSGDRTGPIEAECLRASHTSAGSSGFAESIAEYVVALLEATRREPHDCMLFAPPPLGTSVMAAVRMRAPEPYLSLVSLALARSTPGEIAAAIQRYAGPPHPERLPGPRRRRRRSGAGMAPRA